VLLLFGVATARITGDLLFLNLQKQSYTTVPLEFSEADRGFLVVLKYQRTPFAVEITLDIDINESAYWFVLYASSELSEKGYPIRQSVTEFYYHEYNEEKKRSIHASIQEWIASVGLK
jgi:hypothetical protein